MGCGSGFGCSRRILLVKGAQATASPEGEEVGATPALAFACLQLVREIQEGAEQGGAIVIGQLDETGLLHEATELDEMAGV